MHLKSPAYRINAHLRLPASSELSDRCHCNLQWCSNAVRLFNVRLDGSDAIEGVSLACGFIERIQSEEAAPDGEEQMVLSDRVCLTQHNEDILAVSITTPHRPNSMRQDFNQAQISFSGMLIGTILRSAEDATSDDDE